MRTCDYGCRPWDDYILIVRGEAGYNHAVVKLLPSEVLSDKLEVKLLKEPAQGGNTSPDNGDRNPKCSGKASSPTTQITNHVIKLMRQAESITDDLVFESIVPNLMYLTTLAKYYDDDKTALE